MEALRAWRGEKAPEADKENSKNTTKSVRFNDGKQEESKPAPPAKKKNFFADIENDKEWSVIEGVQFTDGGTKPDEQIGDARYLPKESCW